METKKAVFTMRIDKKEKDQLKSLYNDLGMDLSTAVNLFFRQSLVNDGLPFKPSKVNIDNVIARNEAENTKLKTRKLQEQVSHPVRH